MWFLVTLPMCVVALAIEAMVGYPDKLYRVIGHPVTWMGALLSWLEARLNRPDRTEAWRRWAGVLSLAGLLAATAIVTVPLDLALGRTLAGLPLLVLIAASLPAQRSLDTHVRAVADALERDGVEAGRSAVQMIVGRNTAVLDEAGVARAAIESLAENFADGVVAPALYLALGGLTGGALYKAVNTADSMIGHRSERYRAFGWAAARLDDWVNLPASRLSALWIVLAAALGGGAAAESVRAIRRDARGHRSPNAGWPEAAMAGALDLRLAGPRVYGTQMVEDAYMGKGRRGATARDIRRALALYRMACLIQFAALVVAAAIVRA